MGWQPPNTCWHVLRLIKGKAFDFTFATYTYIPYLTKAASLPREISLIVKDFTRQIGFKTFLLSNIVCRITGICEGAENLANYRNQNK